MKSRSGGQRRSSHSGGSTLIAGQGPVQRSSRSVRPFDPDRYPPPEIEEDARMQAHEGARRAAGRILDVVNRAEAPRRAAG